MTQQKVNLFPPSKRNVETVWAARQFVKLGLLLVVLLWACWGALFYFNGRLSREVAAEKKILQPLSDQVQALQAQIDQRQPSTLLKDRAEQKARELKRKQEMLAWLQRSRTAARGFVAPLTGLTRVQVPGVWLSEVVIASGVGQLQLKGEAQAAEKVAIYLEELGRDGVFEGTQFRTLALERSKQGYAFLLDSQPRRGEP